MKSWGGSICALTAHMTCQLYCMTHHEITSWINAHIWIQTTIFFLNTSKYFFVPEPSSCFTTNYDRLDLKKYHLNAIFFQKLHPMVVHCKGHELGTLLFTCTYTYLKELHATFLHATTHNGLISQPLRKLVGWINGATWRFCSRYILQRLVI